MRATSWEFANRAFIFGILIAIGFMLYSVDHENAAVAVANAWQRRFSGNSDSIARILFFCAAFLVALAALLRTWASAWLCASVVYATGVKTAALVANGPYRFVRNPLYLANVLMAAGFGAIMSRTGFVFIVAAMTLFCYRLILREEGELAAVQTDQYRVYLRAVPRLFPSPWPRVPGSAQRPNWKAGIKAESWYWIFAAGIIVYAATLRMIWFAIITGIGIALLGILSAAVARKSRTAASSS